MRTLMLAAVAGVAMTFSVAAQAEMSPGVNDLLIQGKRELADNQRLVHYGDLNLRGEAGQLALRNRVNSAIADLCDASRFSVADPTGSLKCSNEAWADVKPRLASLNVR
ncbi:UrcA family protein [Sphingomonas jaspsi]|uniref:UrcA family protein n=1 Tax=Sphingomonas jaspsi TaxID=392409 RepID=UPI0004B69AE7|nr:UrcA family protein [Sphingomonas jaspsi]